MPLFRPGKPYIVLGLASPATHTAGLHSVQWTTVDTDGDITWPAADAGEVQIELAGLYRLSLAIARDAIAVSAEATAGIALAGTRIVGTRSPASTTAVYMSCTTELQLQVGDLITAPVQLSGGATAGFNEPACRLSIVRGGPIRWT